jgi:hypothetical protein
MCLYSFRKQYYPEKSGVYTAVCDDVLIVCMHKKADLFGSAFLWAVTEVRSKHTMKLLRLISGMVTEYQRIASTRVF